MILQVNSQISYNLRGLSMIDIWCNLLLTSNQFIMRQFLHISIMRGIGYLFVFILCVNCKKDYHSTNPSQLSPKPILQPEDGTLAEAGSVLSQTRTANLFNCFGEGVLLLWEAGNNQSVSADDGVYAYSKKLSPGRGTLQLQLHDFRFDIPTGATIESITVNARRFKNGKGSIRDYFAHLIKKQDLNPTLFTSYGVRWSLPEYYPNTEATVSYFQNGSGNNGGLGNQVYNWTAEMINDLAFGVRITTYEPVGSSVVVYYDMVTITVQYSLP